MPNLSKKGSRGSSYRSSRPRKRHAPVNQFIAETETKYVSTAAKKLKSASDDDLQLDVSCNYVICNFVTVFTFLSEILVCKSCGGEVKFNRTAAAGVSFKLAVNCSCNTQYVYSSPIINNAAEVNRRFMFAMRMLGAGQQSLKTFCALMDISCSFTNNIYYSFLENLKTAVQAVFEVIQKKSVKEEMELNTKHGNEPTHLAVSGGGSWKKRGHASLHGITSLIGHYSGKVLDLVINSKSLEENCTANHTGTSGKMEPDGVVEMFSRSVESLGVKYKYYSGDDDVSTFENVVQSKPYDDIVPEKKDCEGGLTRNINESFNACVWRLAPKHLHPGSETIEIAAYIAGCLFNGGYTSLLQIMSTLGISIGLEAKNFAEKNDEKHSAEAKVVISNKRGRPSALQRQDEIEEELIDIPGSTD